jgi:hypothetical protein
MWKSRGLLFKDIHMLFLSPLTSIHLKKNREFYFLTSPRTKPQEVSNLFDSQ